MLAWARGNNEYIDQKYCWEWAAYSAWPADECFYFKATRRTRPSICLHAHTQECGGRALLDIGTILGAFFFQLESRKSNM